MNVRKMPMKVLAIPLNLLKMLAITTMGFLGCSCTMPYTVSMLNKAMQDVGLASNHLVVRSSHWRFSHQERIALAEIMKNTGFSHDLQSRTYARFERALLHEFETQFPDIQPVYEGPLPSMLRDAARADAGVLVVPNIVNMDEQLNDWNELKEGKAIHYPKNYGADRIQLQLRVYSVQEGHLIDLVNIHSRSSLIGLSVSQVGDLFRPGLQAYLSLVNASY